MTEIRHVTSTGKEVNITETAHGNPVAWISRNDVTLTRRTDITLPNKTRVTVQEAVTGTPIVRIRLGEKEAFITATRDEVSITYREAEPEIERPPVCHDLIGSDPKFALITIALLDIISRLEQTHMFCETLSSLDGTFVCKGCPAGGPTCLLQVIKEMIEERLPPAGGDR